MDGYFGHGCRHGRYARVSVLGVETGSMDAWDTFLQLMLYNCNVLNLDINAVICETIASTRRKPRVSRERQIGKQNT